MTTRTETRFYVVPLYTWVKEKSSFNTAKIFKDGVHKGTMSAADANAYCEKWNGRRGNFEVKAK